MLAGIFPVAFLCFFACHLMSSVGLDEASCRKQEALARDKRPYYAHDRKLSTVPKIPLRKGCT